MNDNIPAVEKVSDGDSFLRRLEQEGIHVPVASVDPERERPVHLRYRYAVLFRRIADRSEVFEELFDRLFEHPAGFALPDHVARKQIVDIEVDALESVSFKGCKAFFIIVEREYPTRLNAYFIHSRNLLLLNSTHIVPLQIRFVNKRRR